MLSNSDTPIVRELYSKGFDVEQVFMGRAINSEPPTVEPYRN